MLQIPAARWRQSASTNSSSQPCAASVLPSERFRFLQWVSSCQHACLSSCDTPHSAACMSVRTEQLLDASDPCASWRIGCWSALNRRTAKLQWHSPQILLCTRDARPHCVTSMQCTAIKLVSIMWLPSSMHTVTTCSAPCQRVMPPDTLTSGYLLFDAKLRGILTHTS